MDIQIDMNDDVTVLVIAGNLVASEAGFLKSQVENLFEKNVRFILLDMSGINFMDSSGLDVVMSLNKHATGCGGFLVCAALRDNVQKVFRITWADQKIPIAASAPEGLLLMQELRKDQGA